MRNPITFVRRIFIGLFCVVGILFSLKLTAEPTFLSGFLADTSANQLADGEQSTDGSVQVNVNFLVPGGSKFGPGVSARVRLANPYNHFTWFLISDANERFRSTYFKCRWTHSPVPFGATRYGQEGSEAVQVNYRSRDGFTAFLLPPGGTIDFDGFKQWGRGGSARRLQVWLASDVLVNGETRLQDWLPYSIESSQDSQVSRDRLSERRNFNYRWEHTPNPKPYPNETVRFVRIQPMQRYEVNLSSK